MIDFDDLCFVKGDFVWGIVDWEEYSIVNFFGRFKIDISINVFFFYYIGILSEYIFFLLECKNYKRV